MTFRWTLCPLILILALATAVVPVGAAHAQDASTLSAEELEAMFMKQKTRGLVIVPTETAPETAATGTEAAATDVAPSAPAAADLATYVENDADTSVNVQIKFDFDSAALREDEKPKLAQFCPVMQKNAQWLFRIVGHTDAAGTAEYNYRLSLLRAEEVKRHIAATCGVSEDRLIAIGVGKDHLKNEADPRAEENRRVEFQLIS